MATLKLEIVTPEGSGLAADVEMVNLPGVEGELGVLPDHSPLMTRIVPGEISYLQGGQMRYAAIGEGFAEITADQVLVMADMAVDADKIDENKAEEARHVAEERMKQHLSDEEFASVQASLLRSLAQLDVKRRRRH